MRTCGDLCGEAERDLRRACADSHGLKPIRGRYGLGSAIVDGYRAVAGPAGDSDVVREGFVCGHCAGERIAEWVEGVHCDRDVVVCDTRQSASAHNRGVSMGCYALSVRVALTLYGPR